MNILLVDDDSSIIQALLPTLQTVPDATVRVAISGEKAIENAQTMGGVDLLITDVVMDPMDGFALRDQLREQYPSLTTIFITGYDLTDYPEQINGCQVLVKPVLAKDLLAAIQSERQIASNPETPVPVAVSEFETPVAVSEPDIPITVSEPAPAIDENEPPDFLVGQMLGGFKIIQTIAKGRWGNVYEAMQASMGRKVSLILLAPEMQRDVAMTQNFIANASAKANVQNPTVLSVFEAGEASGYCFYTQEYVDGDTLKQIAARKKLAISEPEALKTIRAVSEALAAFHHQKTPHNLLRASDILIDANRRPRLANIALHRADKQPGIHEEMAALANAVTAALDKPPTDKLGALLQKMTQPVPLGFASWAALLMEIKKLEPKIIPADAYKLKKSDIAAIHAVDEAKKRQKRTVLWSIAGIFVLLWIVGIAVWFTFFRQTLSSENKEFSKMEKIPAGSFIFQNGEKKTLPTFWIDKYEVTIGQYAAFLNYLKENPDQATKFDNPKQPKGKSHIPKNWDIYFGRANSTLEKYRNVKFVSISTSCPVFMVDWWDAYAYAKWKGHTLPTEEEWEKAARGTKGLIYPWGDQWNSANCNSGADYLAKPGPDAKAKIDGYIWWSPVNAMKHDRSPFGVMDMAGNVCEWTASWNPKQTSPIIKGGSYFRNLARNAEPAEDCKTTHRIIPEQLGPNVAEEFLGFRTVSQTKPTAK